MQIFSSNSTQVSVLLTALRRFVYKVAAKRHRQARQNGGRGRRFRTDQCRKANMRRR